jgi:sugar lactone lactonase YvrE
VRAELIRGGYQALDGPVAKQDGGLYFSDNGANRIYALDANGAISIWRENTNAVTGLFRLRDGRLLGAESGGGRVISMSPDHGRDLDTHQ